MKLTEMTKRSGPICVATSLIVGMAVIGCELTVNPTPSPSPSPSPSPDPEAFTNADVVRGGGLYDKWWAIAEVDEPTEDHPFWSTRPDTDANARTGSDTWRCKECHGWDYKGVDGAYGAGSHRTGIAGIFGTTKSGQEIFDTIKEDHSFGTMSSLSDDDLWDLAKFVFEGQIDTDDILDGDQFSGSATAGEPLYITACAACHDADGLAIPPAADADHEDWIGLVANENPWEFQHKVRFGQPGAVMPPQHELLTTQEVGELGAHSQTLPQALPQDGGGSGDATAGEAFYVANNCAACHEADASGGIGPNLVGQDGADVLSSLNGEETHTGGTVDGVTQENADDLAAWLASL